MSIYDSRWNSLFANNHKNSFREKVSLKFTSKVNIATNGKKGEKEKITNKPAKIKRIPPPILANLPKKVNEISKYFKPTKKATNSKATNMLYAQVLKKTIGNTEEVLKIKETFPILKAKNIKNIQKIINGNNTTKPKPYINSTTKGPSCKQIIVPMSNDNKINFMNESSTYVLNMNRALKSIKLDVAVDFICFDVTGIVVVITKVASSSDLQTIKQYIKGVNCINSNKVKSPRLPQSKSYLKIIGFSYLQENTTTPINTSVVEKILKKNHIFNNISLASKPRVIKISPKSNMAIIWIDIWNVQSGTNAKMLINRCFNVSNYIAII